MTGTESSSPNAQHSPASTSTDSRTRKRKPFSSNSGRLNQSVTSTQDGANASTATGAPANLPVAKKGRLSEKEKNTNHKDAENKRRNAIRDQFLELSRIVPGTEGMERSEYVMLRKTVAYLTDCLEERRKLLGILERKGFSDEELDTLRLGEEEWGGKEWKPSGVEEWERSKGKRTGDGADAEGEVED